LKKDEPGRPANPRNRKGGRVSLTILKESAIETEAASSQDRSDTMIEPDVLSREIDALKAQQRDAWRQLSSPGLTVFDRREIRNRIRQSELDLRDYLTTRTERLRFRSPPVEAIGNSLANINFRIL
jgi:hypothetical protein